MKTTLLLLTESQMRVSTRQAVAAGGAVGEALAARLTDTLVALIDATKPATAKPGREVVKRALARGLLAASELSIDELVRTSSGRRSTKPKKAARGASRRRRTARLQDTRAPRIGELLFLTRPVGENPLLADLVARSRHAGLLQLTKLRTDPARLAALLDAVAESGESLSVVATRWREEKRLRPAEAAEVAGTIALAALAEGNLTLVAALQAAGVSAPPDLLAWQVDDWQRLVEKLPPAAGDTPAPERARLLVGRVHRAMPTAALLRLARGDLDEISEKDVAAAARVSARAAAADATPRPALAPPTTAGAAGPSRLSRLTALYADLPLAAVLADESLTPASRLERVHAVVGRLDEFLAQNPGIDVRTADLQRGRFTSPEGAVVAIAWDALGADRKPFERQLKSFQRVLRVDPDPALAVSLLASGFRSARQIAGESSGSFLARWGGEAATGRRLYSQAVQLTSSATHAALNAREVAAALGAPGAFYNNVAPDLADYFRSLPGYDDLFGTTTFCACARCKSVHGPAAYFTDLMRFVDLHVTAGNPGLPAGLALRERRPDLWQIPLDCENTNHALPYVDLVNEILEARLRQNYGLNAPYEALLATRHPWNFPFNLPLERMRAYLGQFGQPLAEVFRVCGAGARAVAMERLGLSREEYAIITTPSVQEGALRTAYGVPAPAVVAVVGGLVHELTRVDRFLESTGLTRPELNRLLFQDLDANEVTQDVQRAFYINHVADGGLLAAGPLGSLRIVPVTNDPADLHEELVNLSNAKLDRIHRFVRLARKLGWSFADLDWVLRSLGRTGPAGEIDEGAVVRLAQIQQWHEELKVPLDELCTLWFDVKELGRQGAEGAGPADLFDRVFNHPVVLGGRPPYAFQPLRVLDPADPADPHRPWLRAALGLDDASLARLLPAVPAGQLVLTRPALASLYRTSRLARMAQTGMREFLVLVQLLGIPDLDALRDPAAIARVLEAAAWLRASGFNVHELLALRTRRGNDYVTLEDPEPQVRQLARDIAGALVSEQVSEASFLALEGVSPDVARRLYDDLVLNGMVVPADPMERRGRLSATFQPATAGFSLQPLTAPFDTAPAEAPVIVLLGRFAPRQIVLNRLGIFLGLDPAVVDALLVALGYPLEDAAILAAFTRPVATDAPLPQLLWVVLAALRAGQRVLDKAPLQAAEIRHLAASPQAYNLDLFRNLSLDNVRQLHRCSRFLRSLSDSGAWRRFLDVGDRGEKIAQLAALLHRAPGDVTRLVDASWPVQAALSDTRFANLNDVLLVRERLDLAAWFGIGTGVLLQWAAWPQGAWPEYQAIAASALESLRARYDDAQWPAIVETMHDGIREKQRDALGAYVLARERDRGLRSRADLSRLLLVDVEMSSCARLSRIAQGILSVQNYVQRCRQNLETGVDPATVPAGEWEWRRSYPVWEANRRVFLYPENYLQPELRDDKTQLFREFETTLLQSEIRSETIEPAMRAYLEKLHELATLKIAGSCFDAASRTLYLVGRTRTRPYAFHWRTCVDDTVWSPWTKIDCRINAEVVTPVYAFGRLFLFWMEKTGRMEGQPWWAETGVIGYRWPSDLLSLFRAPPDLAGQVCFTYRDANGRWLTAQTMAEQLPFMEMVPPSKHALEDPNGFGSRYINRPRFLRYWARFNRMAALAGPGAVWVGDAGRAESWYQQDGFLLEHTLQVRAEEGRTRTAGTRYFSTLGARIYKGADGQLHGGLFEQELPGPIPLESYPFVAGLRANEDGWGSIDERNEPGIRGALLREGSVDDGDVTVVPFETDRWIYDNGDESFLIVRRVDPALQELVDRGFDLAGSVERYYFERLTSSGAPQLGWRLFAGGLDRLLELGTQQLDELRTYASLQPDSLARTGSDAMADNRAYAQYYRELFFHLPLLIATRLSAEQRFEEAQRWFRYIFDPTSPLPVGQALTHPNDRYWNYLGFRNQTMPTFAAMMTDPEALRVYREHPFQPHAIARLRVGAYQRSVVMKYLDNLLAWADARFAEDRWESVTEAALLYQQASDILGGRPPAELDPCEAPATRTYDQIAQSYAGGSHIPEFWIEVENAPLAPSGPIRPQVLAPHAVPAAGQTDSLLYFCFPENDELRQRWQRVEDGLYKIRHCLNRAGVASSRPLFDPPIDPMLFVEAAAGGRDLGTVLSEVLRPVPHHRFAFLLEKAQALVGRVQQLGAAFLTAREKQDGEALALLRATQEQGMLELTQAIKEQQVEEAKQQLQALQLNRIAAVARRTYFQSLVEGGLIPSETEHLSAANTAQDFEMISSVGRVGASVARLIVLGIPDGSTIGPSLEYAAGALSAIASNYHIAASIHAITASNLRRRSDWAQQARQAEHEIAQLDAQLEAATVRRDITKAELQAHEASMQNAAAQTAFLQDKFTHAELHRWMSGQLAACYFQSYRLAYDVAKAAERAWQYERASSDTFVRFGHWDSLKQGLLAGEALQLELSQLEKAHLDGDARALEVEKSIALSRLPDDRGVHPTALSALKATGVCEFTLSNTLFELDYPGHYCRQIRSVALSIPAILGPYEQFRATLTQLGNRLLLQPDPQALQAPPAQDALELDPNSLQVRSDWRVQEQIAISAGVNDTGAFALNFADARYLPFEGTGAVSRWRLELPARTNTFDFRTITDVVLALRYTARFDGPLRAHVVGALAVQRGYAVLALRPEDSAGWQRFLHPLDGADRHELVFPVDGRLFPSNTVQQTVTEVFLRWELDGVVLPFANNANLTATLVPPQGNPTDFVFAGSPVARAVQAAGWALGTWTLRIARAQIPPDLRLRQADGTDRVTVINGVDHYTLDPSRVRNLELVLGYRGNFRS